MKKTGLIFSIVSIYIFVAFAWWTYSHIRNSRIIRAQQEEQLQTLCYKASTFIDHQVAAGELTDTSGLRKYLAASFPTLEPVFANTGSALHNYTIRPRAKSFAQIGNQYRRRLWMYTLEGVVMVSLLFWGIILIYRSFLSRMQLKRQQSNFLLSVTHELKTPLASIKLYLETLQRRKVNEDQQGTIIRNSLQDVSRLRDLVDNMLLAAQLENNRYEPDMQPLDLSKLVNETVDMYAIPRELMPRLTKQITPGIHIEGDANAMVMVINNLMSNAFKYSPPDAHIDVQLLREGTTVVMRVCNEGQCIPDSDKKLIFERFYRAGDESIRKSKGTGLGLFIVRNLLSLHGATIDVKDKKPSGVVFTITFKQDAA